MTNSVTEPIKDASKAAADAASTTPEDAKAPGNESAADVKAAVTGLKSKIFGAVKRTTGS